MAQLLRANITWAEYGFAPDDKTLAAKSKVEEMKKQFCLSSFFWEKHGIIMGLLSLHSPH